MTTENVQRRIEIVGVSQGLGGVEKDIRAVGSAQEQLAQASETTARVTETTARRQISAAGAYERLRRQIDQTYRAQQKFAEGQRVLERALEQGAIEARQFAESVAMLQTHYGAANDNARDFAARLDYLRSKFDEGYTAAKRLDAELSELAEAERLGIQISGGYGAALDALVLKHDASAAAAARQAQEYRELAEAERLAATSADGQAKWNAWAGVRQPKAGAARESAAAFEAAAREAELFERKVQTLRASINPMGAAQDVLNAELVEYAAMASRGAITSNELAAAQAMARRRFDVTSEAIRRQTAAMADQAIVGRAGAAQFQTSNIAFQAQDIFVTAAAGMSPLQIALQQGTQLSSVLASMDRPLQGLIAGFGSLLSVTSLVTIGLVAAGAAALQWLFSAKDDAEKLDDVMQDHAKTVEHLKMLYGEAAAAADNLASAGGQAFSSAAIRNDVAALQRELQRQAESVSGELRGDGILTRGLFGSLTDVQDLQAAAGQFKLQVDALIQSAANGSADFAGFNTSLDEVFDAVRRSGVGVTDLYNQIERLRGVASSAFQVTGKFAEFAGPINQLQVGIADGNIDLERFNVEVERIGREKGLQDVADQAIVLGANLVKVTEALEDVERARFRAMEQIRDRLASERYDTGQSYYEDRKRQWELEDRILDAQTRQVQALTDQERIAAAGALARARNPVEGDERRREIAVAERQERERLDQQARESAMARNREREQAIIGAQEEISLIGKTVGEVDRLRYQYAEMAKLREEAARTGRAVDQAEIEAIRQKSAEMGRYAEQAVAARAIGDLEFEREQMGRLSAEREIYAEIHRLGLDINSVEGKRVEEAIRINQQLKRQEDTAKTLAGIFSDLFSDPIKDADEFFDRVTAGFARIAQANIDKLFEGLFSGGGASGSSGTKGSSIQTGLIDQIGEWLGGIFTNRKLVNAQNRAIATAAAQIPTRPLADVMAKVGGTISKTTSAISGSLTAFADAIKTIESSNNYNAIGPLTRRGDRAYGAYQVMGQNIPSWTEEALGRSLSVNEFLADRIAQDKTFDYQFGKLFNKFGNTTDAISAWFSGQPLSKARTRSDGYSTTEQYVAKVEKLVGSSGTIQDAVKVGAKSGIESGISNVAAGSDPWTGLRQTTGGGAGTSGLGGMLGNALSGFSLGFQSGDAGMGGIGGALSGFMAGGPVGAIIGGIAGVIGGIFGKSRQKRQEQKQARLELASQMGAIQSLIDTAMGTPAGEYESAFRQMSDEISKAKTLAFKAGNGPLVKQLEEANETFFEFLVKDWERGLDGVMAALESGHGMDSAFVRAQQAIIGLQDTLIGFVEDAKFFISTGGSYDKAMESLGGSGMPMDYGSFAQRYSKELEDLGIEAYKRSTDTERVRFEQTYLSVDALMRKMEDLGIVFDELGNILTEADIKARTDAEKQLALSIKEAQEAAQQMALRQLTGAEEFTQVELAIQTMEGTAAGLQTTLEKLGMTAEEATKAIEDGLTVALDKLRDSYVKDLTRSVNDLSGAGHINEVMDAIELYQQRLKDSKALGISTALAFTELTLSLREITREAGLSGDDMKHLSKLFPDIANILKGIAPSGDVASAEARVEQAKADLRAAYEEESRAIEATISRLKTFIDGIEDFKASIRLDSQISPLSPFDRLMEAQKRFEEVSTKALAGDETAMDDLEDVSRQYLEEARSYYASSEQYFAIFAQVESILDQALASAKGQLSVEERQLSTLEAQVSKLIDIDDGVMSVAAAIAGLQSAISALDGLGGGASFDPSAYWSKSLKEFYSMLQTYKTATKTDVVPDQLAGVWSAFASSRSGAEYDLLARAYTDILRGLMPKLGMRIGGIVGAFARGGVVGNGIFDRDSVLARYAGGGNIALAGGEFVTRATSVNARTAPVLDYINRTGALPGNDNSALQAELRALRAEVSALRAERKQGDAIVIAGAQHVAKAVEGGTQATVEVGRKVGQQGLRRPA